MAKDLVVGPADLSHLEQAIAAHLTGLGVKHDLEKWFTTEPGETTICCLNGASVVEFLRHVVRCEEYPDKRTGFAAGENGTSKCRNIARRGADRDNGFAAAGKKHGGKPFHGRWVGPAAGGEL